MWVRLVRRRDRLAMRGTYLVLWISEREPPPPRKWPSPLSVTSPPCFGTMLAGRGGETRTSAGKKRSCKRRTFAHVSHAHEGRRSEMGGMGLMEMLRCESEDFA